MKLSKRIVSLLTATALMCSLTACGSGADQATTSDGKKVYHIGICQLVEHEALDAATKGFEDALTKKLGKDNVKFDLQNAQGEETNCSSICTGFVSSNVDLIMANATAALQAASSATADIPIVATSITDYATALNDKKWTGKSGTNISGTSDLAPIDQQEAMIKEMMPKVKNVGILYCSAEPNSIFQAKEMEAALKKDGIAAKTYTAADSNEIQSVTTKAASECEALYVPTDNTMAASVETIKNVVVPAGIPLFAGEQGICAAGVATLSISYYDLGYATGEMAYDILVNGKKPGDMEIQYASKTTKLYNAENCKALKINVPDGYEAIKTESK